MSGFDQSLHANLNLSLSQCQPCYYGRARAKIGENQEKAMTADAGKPATNRAPVTRGNPIIFSFE